MSCSFVRAASFGPPAGPSGRPRAHARKKSGKGKGDPARVLTPQVRTVLDDRISAAIDKGLIEINPEEMECESLDLTLSELALLLVVLLPEEYRDPSEGRRPAKPTGTAPGSAERIAEYAARVHVRRAIYAPGDATADGAHDRGLRIVQRANGSGVKVVGWGEGG